MLRIWGKKIPMCSPLGSISRPESKPGLMTPPGRRRLQELFSVTPQVLQLVSFASSAQTATHKWLSSQTHRWVQQSIATKSGGYMVALPLARVNLPHVFAFRSLTLEHLFTLAKNGILWFHEGIERTDHCSTSPNCD
jgi:hypothetical protein